MLPPRFRPLAALLLAAALAAVLVAARLRPDLLPDWPALLDAARHFAAGRPVLAVLAVALVYALLTGVSLPVAAPLSLACGAALGRGPGFVAAWTGATLGAMLAFGSSRYLLRDWAARRLGSRLDKLNMALDRSGGWAVVSLRLVPALPFALVNLGLGLTGVRARTYLWATALGMVPGAALYVNAGAELGRVDSAGVLNWKLAASLLALAAAPLVLRRLFTSPSAPITDH